MAAKKEARKFRNNTGNGKPSGKSTKRKRIKYYQLVSKWITPSNVLGLERVVE